MLRSTIIASFALGFAAFASSASAQSALSSCNPATGLTPGGAPCVELTPIDPSNIAEIGGAAGGEQYGRLDTSTLGQTYECRTLDARNPQAGSGGALLIEDCGAPLSGSELGELKPFYGTTGAPAPAPVPAAPAPAPVATLPPPPPPPPAAPAFAPVSIPAAGLNTAGLAFGALGAAAIIGIAAVAIADDDDDNNSTNGSGGN